MPIHRTIASERCLICPEFILRQDNGQDIQIHRGPEENTEPCKHCRPARCHPVVPPPSRHWQHHPVISAWSRGNVSLFSVGTASISTSNWWGKKVAPKACCMIASSRHSAGNPATVVRNGLNPCLRQTAKRQNHILFSCVHSLLGDGRRIALFGTTSKYKLICLKQL